MNIYAYRFTGILGKEVFESFTRLLDPFKEKQVLHIHAAENAHRTLIGHIMVRAALIKNHNIDLKNQRLLYNYNDYGKPTLKETENIYFNISHCSDWIVSVTGSAPVGIDIEETRSIGHEVNIARRFFSEEESNMIWNGSDSSRLFYTYWTLKESYIKAIGQGLACPLHSFSIYVPNDGDPILKSSVCSENVYFKRYDLDFHSVGVSSYQACFPDTISLIDLHYLKDALEHK